MPAWIDFDRSEREIPYGDLADVPDGSLADRQWYRRGPDEVDELALEELIRSVVAQVENVIVSAGCITRGKVRPDRLYLELALRRIVQRRPPRRLAIDFGCSNRYVRFGVERGRAILERIGFDAIAETLAQSR